MNELLVDELAVGNCFSVVGQNCIRVIPRKPVFSLLSFFLVEDQINGLVILMAIVLEIYSVSL